MKNLSLMIVFLMSFVGLHAQIDSAKTIKYADFLDLVKKHHPLSIQADIQVSKGEAYLQKSKGLFDPKLYYDIQQKYYNEKQYFSLLDGGVKIPTWFGVELKAGLSQNNGYFLNPEDSNPTGGLLYAGVSVPLGKRLFIDERRSELKKAQIYLHISDAERKLLLNKLLLSAGKAYWDWFKSYNTLEVYEDAYQLANQRLQAVKQSADLGDRPQIDTLEAGIQVQNRLLSLQQARLSFNNAKALIEVFLWADGLIPLELDEFAVPYDRSEIGILEVENSIHAQMDSVAVSHPKLQQYQFKLQQLDIDKRWMKEQLKPKLDLNYQPLTSATDGWANYSLHNYKWGLSFSMPIFLRKERGQLALTNLSIKETNLTAVQTQASVTYEVKVAMNEWNMTIDQVALYSKTVKDYNQLLEGERQLFNIGESSLFMVNSRELGYINAQLKLIELMTKNHQASLKAKYALGNLWQE